MILPTLTTTFGRIGMSVCYFVMESGVRYLTMALKEKDGYGAALKVSEQSAAAEQRSFKCFMKLARHYL